MTIKFIADKANINLDNLIASCNFEATWADFGKVVRWDFDFKNFVIDVFMDDASFWEAQSFRSNTAMIKLKKIINITIQKSSRKKAIR